MQTSKPSEPDQLDVEKTVSVPNSTAAFDKHDPAHDTFEVSLDAEIDPKNIPLWRKWLAVLVINAGAICVSSSSSMVVLQRDYVGLLCLHFIITGGFRPTSNCSRISYIRGSDSARCQLVHHRPRYGTFPSGCNSGTCRPETYIPWIVLSPLGLHVACCLCS